MNTPTAPDERCTPYWLWWLLPGVIGLAVWSGIDFSNRLARHNAVMTRLAAAGTAPGDAWLALLRSDTVATHAAATAGFRERVSADRLAAWAKDAPAVGSLSVKSWGGGRVTQTWFGPADDVPPRLVLAGPGGLTLEFVEEDGAAKLDAVRVNGADPFAGPGSNGGDTREGGQ